MNIHILTFFDTDTEIIYPLEKCTVVFLQYNLRGIHPHAWNKTAKESKNIMKNEWVK